MQTITYLMFISKIFSEVSCRYEEAKKRLRRRTTGILQLLVRVLGINKNDKSDLISFFSTLKREHNTRRTVF